MKRASHFMNSAALSLTLAAACMASPALAQDQMDHSTHTGHAGHDMMQQDDAVKVDPPAQPTPKTEPDHSQHQGHAMPSAEIAPTHTVTPPSVDPHAGHKMETTPAPAQGGAMENIMGTVNVDQVMDDSMHQDHQAMDHQAMGHSMGKDPASPPVAPPPSAALSGPPHAADRYFPSQEMAASRAALPKEMGAMKVATFRIDRLEWQSGKGHDGWLWDGDASYGGDIDKFWIKSEGHGASSGRVEETEVQALWVHAIGPWFDLQTGIRQQFGDGPDRTHLALGVQGLAPYFFEIDGAAFLSTKGDLTVRMEAEYDQRITQKLILQPRVEMNLSAQDIPELGMGSGFTSMQVGARLRYEIIREFAPYIGVEWQSDLGQTARYTRANGDDPGRTMFVAGIRFWF